MRAKDFRNQAWELLKKRNYWMFFLITLVFLLVTGASSFIILLVVGTLSVGHSLLYLRAYRGEDPKLETIFQPFSTSYVNTLIASLLTFAFVFLWSLLLLIPGIIKSYAYSMTKYILADNPELDGYEAMKQSEHLMVGHKWRLFCLQFSFIGWAILSLFTFGIGYFFLVPYITAAETAFYLDLIKEKVVENKTIEEIEVVEL